MSIEKSRDLSIDAARGVALFFVALSHAHHNPHYVTAFYIMAFFFLSGWLYKPGKSYEENIKKKAQRVLLPYFSNSVILLVIYSLMKHFSSQEIERTINGIMYSRNAIVIGVDEPIMGSIANNPLWYLTAFFATSLLFHLIVDKCTSDRRIFLLSNLILITISILLSQLPILLPWSLDMIFFFASVMLIGYWFKFNNVNLDLSWTTTIFLILGYVVICYENGPINLSVRNLGGGT